MKISLNTAMLQNYGKVVGLLALTGLAACAAPPPSATPHYPYESTNRVMHGFNRGIDKALVRPSSKVYGVVLPQPVKTGVANFATNLDLPGDMVNGMMQGNINGFGKNFFRFAINSTLGVGGLFDPAKSFGLEQEKTDFGQTLHVWGVGEGAYVELPGVGPSTVRDAVGTAVDIAANPVSLVLPSPESYYATVAKVGSKLGDRDRYSSTIDSILYDSADSYAQARLLYLQNRRFELGQTAEAGGAGDDFIDPYAE